MDILDTRDVDGTEYRVYLEHDPECEDPREMGDHFVGRIVCVHSSRYVRPDESGDVVSARYVRYAMEDHSFRAVARWLRLFWGASVVLPLYSGYDDRPSAGDVTDSPVAGDYIGVTFDQPSTRRMTGVESADIELALSVEVDEWSAWARGDCYGYVVERATGDDEWEQTDSCWGFIGDDYARAEAMHAFDAECSALGQA